MPRASLETPKDYTEYKNFVFTQIFPSRIIKEAFAAKVISDADGWMATLDARNKISHTYDFSPYEMTLKNINKQYLDYFAELYEKLASETT